MLSPMQTITFLKTEPCAKLTLLTFPYTHYQKFVKNKSFSGLNSQLSKGNGKSDSRQSPILTKVRSGLSNLEIDIK